MRSAVLISEAVMRRVDEAVAAVAGWSPGPHCCVGALGERETIMSADDAQTADRSVFPPPGRRLVYLESSGAV